jgi:hypothetical protein
LPWCFAAVPTAPRSPEAIDWSPSYVELSWKEPTSDGGAVITGFIIEKRDKYRQVSLEANNSLVLANTCLLTYLFNNSVMWEKAMETSDPLCQAKVVNLIENMEYQFRVIAVNKAGNSEPSEATKTIITKARFRKCLFTLILIQPTKIKIKTMCNN